MCVCTEFGGKGFAGGDDEGGDVFAGLVDDDCVTCLDRP